MPTLSYQEILLLKHELRKTKIRVEMLKIFTAKQYAIAHSEIEQTLGKAFDRVSIYRTLNSFEEKGLIHKVLDDSGAAKYAYCADHFHTHKHYDSHVHFSCTVCKHTYCLEHVPIPPVELPKDYHYTELSFLAQGVCKDCSLSAKQ